MFFLELGQGVSYFHREFRLDIYSPEEGGTGACRQHSGTSGFHLQRSETQLAAGFFQPWCPGLLTTESVLVC